MNRLLTFELEHSSPIPFSLLHNARAVSEVTERFFYKDSLIYFICRVRKVRFDLNSVIIENDKITLNLIFQNRNTPASFIIKSGRKVSFRPTSTNKILLLDIEGCESENPMLLTPDLVLRKMKFEIGNRPELLYIGYSFEPIERLLKHEKIIKASAEIDDESELRLYVSSFKFSYCWLKEKQLICIGDIGIKKEVTALQKLKEYIMLVERILIHYFQTEGLNDNHIDMDIKKDRLFKKILKINKIQFIGGGYDMDGGEYFDFWSLKMNSPSKDFYLDYNNIKDGYLSHDEAMRRFFVS